MSDVKEGGFGFCEERAPHLGRLESGGAELLDQQTDDGLQRDTVGREVNPLKRVAIR